MLTILSIHSLSLQGAGEPTARKVQIHRRHWACDKKLPPWQGQVFICLLSCLGPFGVHTPPRCSEGTAWCLQTERVSSSDFWVRCTREQNHVRDELPPFDSCYRQLCWGSRKTWSGPRSASKSVCWGLWSGRISWESVSLSGMNCLSLRGCPF